jgi:chromosome partitioning protein
MMAAIITMLNLKGGVGKSTCTFHLGCTLATTGRRVLLVDNDPQTSLSQGVWGPEATAELDPAATIASVYAGDVPPPSQVIRATGIAGVDLLPGSRLADQYNVPRPHLLPWEQQAALREVLDEARPAYDLVLVDCPPNLYGASWAAMVASDAILVPCQCEDYGSQGLEFVRESLAMVLAGANPRLVPLGLVLTMVAPRRALHQAYEQKLRAEYGPAVFAATIPHAAELPEATSLRRPIHKHKPRGGSAKAFAALAEEVLTRLEAHGLLVREVAA